MKDKEFETLLTYCNVEEVEKEIQKSNLSMGQLDCIIDRLYEIAEERVFQNISLYDYMEAEEQDLCEKINKLFESKRK